MKTISHTTTVRYSAQLENGDDRSELTTRAGHAFTPNLVLVTHTDGVLTEVVVRGPRTDEEGRLRYESGEWRWSNFGLPGAGTFPPEGAPPCAAQAVERACALLPE